MTDVFYPDLGGPGYPAPAGTKKVKELFTTPLDKMGGPSVDMFGRGVLAPQVPVPYDKVALGTVPVQSRSPFPGSAPVDKSAPASISELLQEDEYRAQPFEMSTKDGKVSWSGGGALPGSAMKATPEETATWLKAHSAGQTGVGALLGYQPEATSAGLADDPIGSILARDNQNAAATGYNAAVVGQGDARQARIGDANHINEIMRQQALRESSVRRLVEQYGTDDPKILEKLIPLDAAMKEQQSWREQISNLNKLKGRIPDNDYEALKDSLILQMTKNAEEAGRYSTDMVAARARASAGLPYLPDASGPK